MVPQYRLDEIREQERAARLRAETAEAELARLRAAPPPAAAPAPPAAPPPADVDPANQAIRDRLLEVFPEFRHLKDLVDLAARKGDIEETTDAIRRYKEAETLFYDRHTATQLGTLHTLAAGHLLGAGKTAADLPVMAREALTDRFSAWVLADPARVARYNALDPELVGEFWPIYRAAIYDPGRRADSAAALSAAGARPALPVGGAISAPVATAPPKPAASDDEDAIHERAWQGVEAARRG
jgi:hypothetical protein